MRALLLGCFLLGTAGMMAGCASDDEAASNNGSASDTSIAVTTGTLTVEAAWARPGGEGGMSALYARIGNGTARADTLQSVATAVANTVEIHESYEGEDGTRGMRPIGPVPVPAGEQVTLAPGGKHVMLIRLNQALQPNDSLAVDFRFARAGTQSMKVPVRLQPPE